MYDSSIDTKKHIQRVQEIWKEFSEEISYQIAKHDESKLEKPEKEIFDEYTPKLQKCEYGSEEYKENLKQMEVALNHHYAHNSHHPEHYLKGISGMDLFDFIEMFCNWVAAVERNPNGSLKKSIEINQNRFGYSEDIKSILMNTVKRYFIESKEEEE